MTDPRAPFDSAQTLPNETPVHFGTDVPEDETPCGSKTVTGDFGHEVVQDFLNEMFPSAFQNYRQAREIEQKGK